MRAREYDTLSSVSRLQAARSNESPAITMDERTITFGELDRRATAIACQLASHGIEQADRIAILSKNRPEMLECLFASAMIGAVFTPFNWRLAIAEVEYLLKDSQAAAIFADPEHAAVLDASDIALPPIKVCYGEAPKGWLTYEEIATDALAPFTPPALTGRSACAQVYTSGTTGKPKGAVLSHAGFSRFCDMRFPEDGDDVPDFLSVNNRDIYLTLVPLFHIGGLEIAMRALAGGAHLIIEPEFNPQRVLELIRDHRVTITGLVPTALQMVIEHPLAATVDLSSVRTMFYGASPMPLALLQDAMRVMSCEFAQGYGMTETNGMVAILPPNDHSAEGNDRMRAVGRALHDVEVAIVGDRYERLPAGSVGEIAVRGPHLMLGYWNNPEATADAFNEDGWMKTGDAGYMDEDGYIFLKDRIKDLIISGAENIYPAEVENVIFDHPAVSEVAIIGVPDQVWGESVKAVIVAKPSESIDEQELIGWTRERIAAYKAPKSVALVDALPKNASGKVLKHELRRMFAN